MRQPPPRRAGLASLAVFAAAGVATCAAACAAHAAGIAAPAGGQEPMPPAASATRPRAPAERVAFAGSMGSRALLVIDGAAPRAMAVGSTAAGVKLVSVGSDEAVVEVDGRRRSLRLGASALNLGGAASAGNGQQISLSSSAGGHFLTSGQINGRSASFMVDTGATLVSIGQPDAERLGLDYRSGDRVATHTANGDAIGWLVTLNTVRVGDVDVHNVPALVQPQSMPFVLLGNSFLTRFQMRRDNDTLTLLRRF